MGKPGGLFAAPAPADEEDDPEEYAGDLDDIEEPDESEPLAAGPFDSYAKTVFDENADPAERADALRQAIMTMIEESGRGPG
jgi:hypothetical protein